MRAIKINERDNVAVTIAEAKKGDVLEGFSITLRSDVPQGHKVALKPIGKGEACIQPILIARGYVIAIGHEALGSHLHL